MFQFLQGVGGFTGRAYDHPRWLVCQMTTFPLVDGRLAAVRTKQNVIIALAGTVVAF